VKPRNRGRDKLGFIAVALWAMTSAVILYLGYRLFIAPPPQTVLEKFPPLPSTAVLVAPDGHAYRYVAAPFLTWEAARAAATKAIWRGKAGYLATIDSQAEFHFVTTKVFPGPPPDVTYLGGRQTAPGEWRWVTGPDGAADGGKGKVFWLGDERGTVQGGEFAAWEYTAFQHGGKWDTAQVCCVTIYSYGLPQFSTSLGNGDKEEGVSGYLVEWGE
jgi:hypothetical protein